MALHRHPIRLAHPQQQEQQQHPQPQEQQHQHQHQHQLHHHHAQDHPLHCTNRPSTSSPLPPSPRSSPPPAFLPPSTSIPTSPGMQHRFIAQRTPSVDETLTTMLASSSPKSLTGSTRSASLLESAIIGNIHSRSFYSALDATEEILEEDPVDENIQQGSAKRSRRLTLEQVRALEKSFEADNKLDPERKVQLASQLGLQSRQVAVWFQNRRARWKTKQMERDFGTLKKKLESLRANRDELKKEKERLEAEVARLNGNIDKKSEEKLVKSEAAADSRTSRSEVTSNLAVRECENAAAITRLSPDQKENDGSSITEDSDGSAIVDNVDSPRQIQSSVPDLKPATVICSSGDIVMQDEAIAMLDVADFQYGRFIPGALVTQRAIKGEEIFYEEESGGPFYPFEWWETA